MVDRNVSIKIDTAEFKKGLGKVTEEIIKLELQRMNAATHFVEAEAVKEAPSDTGQLRAGMFSTVERKNQAIVGTVGNINQHAAYVHQGTGIYATNGKGRKTPWRVVTTYKGKKVAFWTRGIKPNPFLTRAKEKNIAKIKRLLGVK